MDQQSNHNYQIELLYFTYENQGFKENVDNPVFEGAMALADQCKKKIEAGMTGAFAHKLSAIVLFVMLDNLRDKTFYNQLALWEYRTVRPGGRQPLPVITIGVEDIMSLEQTRWVKILHLDQRFKFLDSSIWHCYIPFNQQFQNYFTERLSIIWENSRQGIFSTNVAHEFIEFQSRMLLNSYLSVQGGHSSSVTPFPFHSESQMKSRYEKDLENYKRFQSGNNTSNLMKGLKWRILLIDDKSLHPLSKIKAPLYNGNDLLSTKVYIIATLLLQAGFKVTIPSSPDIQALIDLFTPGTSAEMELVCVDNVEDAVDMVGKSCFDIILLDFLLDEKKKKFGVDFFDQILKTAGPNKTTLFGKHWIISISSYHIAFLDAIHAIGKTMIGNGWYFSRGADPVNTPWLFMEQLIQFLIVQLREVGIDDAGNKLNFDGISGLWKEALGELCAGQKFTRSWANKTLSRILAYWENIESLKESSAGNSLFAQSFLKPNEENSFYNKIIMSEYDNGLYGYLTHLLFILAYGDGYKWNEMKTDLEVVKSLVLNDNLQDQGYAIINARIKRLKEIYDQ